VRHVKYPYNGVEVAIVGKITGHFSPMVPLSLLEVSRVVVDVEARCKWELTKHRVNTISLQAAVHSWGGSRWGPYKKKKKKTEVFSKVRLSRPVNICRRFGRLFYSLHAKHKEVLSKRRKLLATLQRVTSMEI
jgi:hypothetical protein